MLLLSPYEGCYHLCLVKDAVIYALNRQVAVLLLLLRSVSQVM